MGRYIERTDLDEYLSEDARRQLTDDDNSKSIDADIEDECIAGAEDFFDGYIAKRYTVPLTSHTGIVEELCVIFSTQRLYARRGRMPEPFEKIYDGAMDTLDKILKGDIVIDGADESDSELDSVEVTTQTRVHSRSKWSGW